MKKTNLTLAIYQWLPAILFSTVIFTFSSIEVIKVSELVLWDFIAKKTAHVVEFAILFTLIFRASKGNGQLSYFLTILYAVSDEYHQSFVPGRTASIFDLGFDVSGANIASYIIWKLRLFQKKKPKS